MKFIRQKLPRFYASLWLTMAMFVVFAISFVIYVQAEKRIDRANELRHQSYLLADELRQSSDDLSRMVRSYVITGDPAFKQHYQEILNIRNGDTPRPVDYHLINWDLVVTDDQRPRPLSGQKTALLDLMRHAGFTDAEFSKLAAAKVNSDALTRIDYAAMQLLESTTPPTDENRIKASLMLSDAEYRRGKAAIMLPISEFYQMMDSRTLNAVHASENAASHFRLIFILFGVLLVFMLWYYYRALHTTLGCSVNALHEHIARLGSGDFSSTIPVGSGMENSVLAWLSETQTRLALLNDERQQAEVKNQRLTQLYSALSQCNQAIVRSRKEDELFPEICRNAVTYGGMQLAWIGLLDNQNQLLRPVASFGYGTEYLEDIQISIDSNPAIGRGPTGTAMREDRPIWCQDFQNDPATAPWHQRGLKFGWRASAALPLHKNDAVYGVITFYATTINAFDQAARDLLMEMAIDIDHALNNFDTERQHRHAETELANSRNLLQTIIDTAPLRIFWKDQDLNYLGCNPAFAKDAGVAHPDELIGKNDYQLTWKAHAELYRADDRRVIDSGAPKLFYEEPLTTADGNTVWLRTSKVLLRNTAQQTIGVLGIYQDITTEKQTQLALQRSEANLNRAQAVAKIGSWRLDTEHELLEWSAETYHIFDLAIGTQITYEAFISHVYPDDLELVNNAWQAALEGLPYHIEHRITVDGEIRWVEERAELEFDEAGNCRVGVGTVQDITERKRAQERIGLLTNFDPLTGLPNRTQLNTRICYAINLAKRSHAQLALVFLDLDHFKDINDTLGHSVGDALLIELADRMRHTLREEDTVARLGGDEFIILLPDVDAHGAEFVAQKLLDAISKPYPIEHYNLSLTASIGIALYPYDGEDLETLSRSADTAMYRAKQEGRHDYRFFTPEMQASSARNLQLVHALRHALDLEQIQVYYQPQVSMVDGHIIGVEALLRWQHPELGMVSPGEFIPVAEDSGLILPIGEWVLRNAVRQVNAWREQGLASLIIAVNLSAVQFRHPDLPDLVTRILDEVGLPPEFLELELTEGVAMNNPEGAIAVITNLHERGIRMSIDDFGTGYSSLSYLKKFKVYKLKIDRSFVRDISTDPEDKAIVRAVISLAKSLGLKTIAEGVETTGQLAFLQEQGCDELQGYLFSPPVPAEQFEILLKKGFSD